MNLRFKNTGWQFGLRTLLIFTAIAAALSWWSLQPPKGMLVDWRTAKIKVGMTLDEVQAELPGSICEVGMESPSLHTYQIHRPLVKDGAMIVYFDANSDRVSEVVIH